MTGRTSSGASLQALESWILARGFHRAELLGERLAGPLAEPLAEPLTELPPLQLPVRLSTF